MMDKPQTTIDKAKEAYEKILSIKPSFAKFPPTEQEEIAEHDRVYLERVAVIERLLNV